MPVVCCASSCRIEQGDRYRVVPRRSQITLRRALVEFAGFAPRAIGLACAGTVDNKRGVVVTSPNLPLREVPLAGILSEALGIPVILENDGRCPGAKWPPVPPPVCGTW